MQADSMSAIDSCSIAPERPALSPRRDLHLLRPGWRKWKGCGGGRQGRSRRDGLFRGLQCRNNNQMPTDSGTIRLFQRAFVTDYLAFAKSWKYIWEVPWLVWLNVPRALTV